MRRFHMVCVGVLSAVLLVGCESYPEGPAGKVVEKEKKLLNGAGDADYFLTVRDEQGSPQTFQVSPDDFDRCYRGSSYPKCTKLVNRS